MLASECISKQKHGWRPPRLRTNSDRTPQIKMQKLASCCGKMQLFHVDHTRWSRLEFNFPGASPNLIPQVKIKCCLSGNFCKNFGLNNKRQNSGTLSYFTFSFSLSTVVLHAIYNFPLLTLKYTQMLCTVKIANSC